MPRVILNTLILTAIMMSVSACSTTKGVSMRAYMQDKERVDQEVEGTLGNWENSSMTEDNSKKNTRKVYILEVTQDLDEPGVDALIKETSTTRTSTSTSTYPSEPIQAAKNTIKKEPKATLPSLPTFSDSDEDAPAAKGRSLAPSAAPSRPESFLEYTVEKDDTLQKISKKFYNSYSKWTQIYEANKATMKDPNSIKPGMTLRIPVE
ncbi:MAG: LysM peptidoglycan-binding domain-containing protein [Candidatus Omnitrophica bacterium]|nr:LysM peptidoglycan-binding domain-containing protein [Candidatus Omnitrophota bacterium]